MRKSGAQSEPQSDVHTILRAYGAKGRTKGRAEQPSIESHSTVAKSRLVGASQLRSMRRAFVVAPKKEAEDYRLAQERTLNEELIAKLGGVTGVVAREFRAQVGIALDGAQLNGFLLFCFGLAPEFDDAQIRFLFRRLKIGQARYLVLLYLIRRSFAELSEPRSEETRFLAAQLTAKGHALLELSLFDELGGEPVLEQCAEHHDPLPRRATLAAPGPAGPLPHQRQAGAGRRFLGLLDRHPHGFGRHRPQRRDGLVRAEAQVVAAPPPGIARVLDQRGSRAGMEAAMQRPEEFRIDRRTISQPKMTRAVPPAADRLGAAQVIGGLSLGVVVRPCAEPNR